MKSSRTKNQRVSKPKHRRHQHLLEVSVRRDIARMQRFRAVLFFTCKTLLIVGIIAGVYFGGKECLRRFLWENPDYYLAELRLNTDGTLTHEQVRTTAEIELGKNIFTIDLANAREKIDRLPQVERVELQRVLPNRIEVNIIERRPIAWLAEKPGKADKPDEAHPSLSAKSFLVDSRGVAMRIKTQLPEYLSLPVIVGPSMENIVLGKMIRSYEMQAALKLIQMTTDNTRFHPRTLDISKGYCVVVTDQRRRKITFGLERVDHHVARLMHFIDFSEINGKQIQTVNLLVERNTPVTFVEPEPEAPAAAPVGTKEKDAKGKGVTVSKKPEPAATPKPTPVSPPPKSSTPSRRSNGPADAVKKPFSLNG